MHSIFQLAYNQQLQTQIQEKQEQLRKIQEKLQAISQATVEAQSIAAPPEEGATVPASLGATHFGMQLKQSYFDSFASLT